jgi:UDP-N-acetylenolpyruvoylglucosamine reductase
MLCGIPGCYTASHWRNHIYYFIKMTSHSSTEYLLKVTNNYITASVSVCGDGELSTTNNFYVQFEYNCSLWKQNIVISQLSITIKDRTAQKNKKRLRSSGMWPLVVWQITNVQNLQPPYSVQKRPTLKTDAASVATYLPNHTASHPTRT